MDSNAFRLHTLPAGNGDALVLEYASHHAGHRVLVDGGVAKTGRAVAAHLGPDAPLELMVVTHIDNDHIAGVLRLFDDSHPPRPGDVWFNGFRHFPESGLERFGPTEGEDLTELIVARRFAWNAAFDGAAVTVDHPAKELAGGLRMTVLSPGMPQLSRLRERTTWAEIVQDAESAARLEMPPERAPRFLERMGFPDLHRLADEHTTQDRAPANGSSIALIAEFEGRSCLLSGDAHPRVLLSGIDAVFGQGEVLEVDVFKLPHHGSKANVTAELISRVRARHYVFSTDGTGQQRHPDDQAVARVIKYGGHEPHLVFNYRSPRNAMWDDQALKSMYGYRTSYPADGQTGITIDLVNDVCA